MAIPRLHKKSKMSLEYPTKKFSITEMSKKLLTNKQTSSFLRGLLLILLHISLNKKKTILNYKFILYYNMPPKRNILTLRRATRVRINTNSANDTTNISNQSEDQHEEVILKILN